MIGCRVVSLTVNDAKCLSGDIGCGGVEVLFVSKMNLVSQCYLSRPAQSEVLLLNILINTHGQDGSISFIEA